MNHSIDFQKGKDHFYDKSKSFEDCKTGEMINGWNNEERLTKCGFTLENWYISRDSYSL